MLQTLPEVIQIIKAKTFKRKIFFFNDDTYDIHDTYINVSLTDKERVSWGWMSVYSEIFR